MSELGIYLKYGITHIVLVAIILINPCEWKWEYTVISLLMELILPSTNLVYEILKYNNDKEYEDMR